MKLGMFEIQHKKEKDFKQNQDFRKYYPDAVIQKLVIIRNSVKKKKERNVQKQDYRNYFPDDVLQLIVLFFLNTDKLP